MALKTVDLGPVSSYAIAVSKGYTGTEQEWYELIHNVTTDAQSAADSAASAARDAAAAAQSLIDIGTAKTAAIGEIQDEGTTQKGIVTAEGTTQVGNVQDAKTLAVAAVQAQQGTSVQAVYDKGTEQVTAVGSEGNTQIGLVTAEGTEQVGLVEAKGQEVLESIPEDYSSLVTQANNTQFALENTKILPYNYIKYISGGQIDTSTNKWADVGSRTKRFSVMPVKAGDSLVIKANATLDAQVAILKSYDGEQEPGDDPDFSTATGWTAVKTITAGTTFTGTVPSDAVYLYCYLGTISGSTTPASILIGGYDFTQNLYANISEIVWNVGDLKSAVVELTQKGTIKANYRQGFLSTGGSYNTSNSGKSYAFDISTCTKTIFVEMKNNNICRYAFYTKTIDNVTSSDTANVYKQYNAPFPHSLFFPNTQYAGYKTLIISTDYNNSDHATIFAYEDLSALQPETVRIMYNNVGKFNNGTSNKMSTADATAKMANYRDFYAQYQPNILGMEEFPLDTDPCIDDDDSVAPNESLYPMLYPYTTTPYQYAVVKSDYKIVEEVQVSQSITGYFYGLRGSLAAVETPNGRQVGVFSTVFDIGTGHYDELTDREANRAAQRTAAIALLAKYDYGVILVDTNMESSTEYDDMKAKFEEAGYQVVNGGFFPQTATCPAASYKPIDNIFVKGTAKIKSFIVPDVLSSLASDHLPVMADVLFY